MRAARELAQHPGRVSRVGGLSERLVVQPHDGVGRHEQAVGGRACQRGANRLGLLGGEARHELGGPLARTARLVDVRRDDREVKAGVGEQLATTG